MEKKLNLKKLLTDNWLYVVLACLVIIFSIISPKFLGKANIGNFFRQIPTVGIITIGITMVLITGGVDLSIGSIAAFAGTTAAYLATIGVNPLIVISITLLIGLFWGGLNGLLITKFKLEPFILTLGTNYLIRGIILFVTNGIYIKGVPNWFYNMSNTKVFLNIIYSNTIIFAILVIAAVYLMKNTRFGRYCYAIGSNTEAARLSGIKTERHYIKVYMLEGCLAAVAGILLMSSLNVGAPDEAVGLDAFAMAAAIVGGTRFGGGIGTIGGAIAGIFTIEIFKNGLTMLGMNAFVQDSVTGLIIIGAIIIDFYRKGSFSKVKKVVKKSDKNIA
ncbi:ABC transporter permease [Terrisporobacter sp.]|uniref:ABC transporter permease n=1 Tax=Terrisporobacter sp. TaxID=1965305 RepID=UPI002629CED1|nr:ABC transporter permease [Terrisporobacter sp.]